MSKKDKFFAGYIEIFCCSRIYKIPIIILEPFNTNNTDYYKLNISFKDINDNKDIFNVEELIFVLYRNKIHYDYLKINKSFLLEQIISSFKDNQQALGKNLGFTDSSQKHRLGNKINPDIELEKDEEPRKNEIDKYKRFKK